MAKILVVDDEHSILESLEMFLSEKGHKVYTADTGEEGFALFYSCEPEVVILDIRLPDQNGLDLLSRIQRDGFSSKVIMITAFQDMETAIQAMKTGAYDYIRKPLDVDEIEKAVDRALQVLEIEREVPLLETVEKPANREIIVGKSRKMLEIFKRIGLLCQNRVPVLIQGETGTGKGLVARMIHRNSPYHAEPFITLDCSAIV